MAYLWALPGCDEGNRTATNTYWLEPVLEHIEQLYYTDLSMFYTFCRSKWTYIFYDISFNRITQPSVCCPLSCVLFLNISSKYVTRTLYKCMTRTVYKYVYLFKSDVKHVSTDLESVVHCTFIHFTSRRTLREAQRKHTGRNVVMCVVLKFW
jgi:hypothetical protein